MLHLDHQPIGRDLRRREHVACFCQRGRVAAFGQVDEIQALDPGLKRNFRRLARSGVGGVVDEDAGVARERRQVGVGRRVSGVFKARLPIPRGTRIAPW